MERRASTEAAQERDLGRGNLRQAEPLLGTRELLALQEIAESDSCQRRDPAADMRPVKADRSGECCRPGRRAVAVARLQIEINRAVKALPVTMHGSWHRRTLRRNSVEGNRD